MNKTNILISVDNDVSLYAKLKYSSNRQLSSLVNNFLKNLIDFENPEEEKIKEEIKNIENNILSLRSEKAMKETILNNILEEKQKEEDKEKKERLEKARMLNRSIKASGVLRDWGLNN